MLNINNRIREELIKEGNKFKKQYVHKCIDCSKEIFKTRYEEKTTTGYCCDCVHNHKKTRKDACKFNEKDEKYCHKIP